MISNQLSVIRCEFLSVKPHTPHPTPYTPHPTPYTSHPTPRKNFLPQTLIRAAIPVKFLGSYLYGRGNFGLEYRQLNVN
ncbi:MAG: hypothetical protein DWQ58_03070 [Microcystis aeruginosa TA09]|nr:MAG: hypothetical protein DWQ58_03070 [Microcystis aeruginosa TA09]